MVQLLKSNIKSTKNKNLEKSKLLRENKENIYVELVSLIQGKVNIYDKINRLMVFFTTENPTNIVTVETLLTLDDKEKKDLIETMALGIMNVKTKDMEQEVTIADVIEGLDLVDTYAPFKKGRGKTETYDILNIDGMLIESSLDEFKEFCNKCNVGLLNVLVDRLLMLRSNGYLNDGYKFDYIAGLCNKPYIFNRV